MYYIPIRQISQQIIFVCFIFSVKTKDIDITISNILEGKIIIAFYSCEWLCTALPGGLLTKTVLFQLKWLDLWYLLIFVYW
jgi:hypothetical protein